MRLLIYSLVALPMLAISSSFDYTKPIEMVECNYTLKDLNGLKNENRGFDIAEDYGIDYKLIKAVAVIESG